MRCEGSNRGVSEWQYNGTDSLSSHTFTCTKPLIINTGWLVFRSTIQLQQVDVPLTHRTLHSALRHAKQSGRWITLISWVHCLMGRAFQGRLLIYGESASRTQGYCGLYSDKRKEVIKYLGSCYCKAGDGWQIFRLLGIKKQNNTYSRTLSKLNRAFNSFS